MRPSFMSALWIVAGVGTIAGSIAVLIGLVTEWGQISGALGSGSRFDLWLVIEIALVAAVVVLLIATTREARRR
jgi:hypothetical protein